LIAPFRGFILPDKMIRNFSDHSANERSFLAWVRTAIAVMAFAFRWKSSVYSWSLSLRPQQLCTWVEENIEETLTFCRLPREHRKHLKSTNMLERLSQEIKRRAHVIRIFPNEDSALRLIRALAVEIHEDWIEARCYLNMEMLRQQRKQLQLLEAA
jgi:transposase-like protein